MKTNRILRTTGILRDAIRVPSVEERLRKASQSIVLALAALRSSDAPELIEATKAELTEVITSILKDASEEVYWLMQLPPDVLKQIAPNGDQADELKAGAVPIGGAA